MRKTIKKYKKARTDSRPSEWVDPVRHEVQDDKQQRGKKAALAKTALHLEATFFFFKCDGNDIPQD